MFTRNSSSSSSSDTLPLYDAYNFTSEHLRTEERVQQLNFCSDHTYNKGIIVN